MWRPDDLNLKGASVCQSEETIATRVDKPHIRVLTPPLDDRWVGQNDGSNMFAMDWRRGAVVECGRRKEVTWRYRTCTYGVELIYARRHTGVSILSQRYLSTRIKFQVSYLLPSATVGLGSVRCRSRENYIPWCHYCAPYFSQEGASHIRVSKNTTWASIAPMCKCTVIKIRRSSATHVIWSVYQYWPITTTASCFHSLTNDDKTVSSSSSFFPLRGWSTGSLLFDCTPMCALRPSTGLLWIHCLDPNISVPCC